jgi:putative ABC transport system ATP-binding protein
VHKRFGDVVVLRGLDLAVGPREFLAVSGPSGGGKSTLLHLLAALDRPTSGRIVVNGHVLGSLRAVNRYRRHDVGIVFQLFNLLPHMSAARNVELAMFGTRRSAREREGRAAELLGELDLAHAIDRSPSRLSGGERQRVAIARAIANEPRVLLADEPTGNLDPTATESVLALFERLRSEREMAVVMVTHDRAVAAHADRHLELVDGVLRPVVAPAAAALGTGASVPPAGRGRVPG